ncbi:MAG: YdcF family protein, partial [Desulfobulbaceae bacterium]|nr:YdcF family protein [Desulfobulbaceae bacterium]
YPRRALAAGSKADAGAVLFQDFADTPAGISNETARRVNHGIALFRQGKLNYLVMTGGFRPGATKTGADLMAAYAEKAGMPAAAILTDQGSFDSTSNLAGIADIAANRHWQHLILISSPHHLARLNRWGLGPLTLPCTLSPYDPDQCSPALTRYEIWRSVHYNLIADSLWRLLPAPLYQNVVAWIRAHTSL